MLDFFTDIKNELDNKYNDATIYENREIAKRAAENYIDDVQTRLSDYAKCDTLYKRDASATDLPCMSFVKVWVKPGQIALYNKAFRYKDDEVTYMAKAELDQWFTSTCQELKYCGMLQKAYLKTPKSLAYRQFTEHFDDYSEDEAYLDEEDFSDPDKLNEVLSGIIFDGISIYVDICDIAEDIRAFKQAV